MVDNHDRLVVQTKLAPGDHFDRLVDGADPARQGDEGVGQFEHALLAQVHRVDHFEPGQAAVGDFLPDQTAGDDADGPAAGIGDAVRNHAHQADAAAAEHQVDVVVGE